MKTVLPHFFHGFCIFVGNSGGMKNNQQQAAKLFAESWQGKGYEKGESQPFWLSLLRDVYGVEHPV